MSLDSDAFTGDDTAAIQKALDAAVEAWAIGQMSLAAPVDDADEDEINSPPDVPEYLKEQLTTFTVEAGILDRSSGFDSKFRLLDPDELKLYPR